MQTSTFFYICARRNCESFGYKPKNLIITRYVTAYKKLREKHTQNVNKIPGSKLVITLSKLTGSLKTSYQPVLLKIIMTPISMLISI